MKRRLKVIECADGIIDYVSEHMIMQRVYDDFGHDLSLEESEAIANAVYQQIKLRM
tara:strand:- start:7 stop:174 length:168 start_codon:yes stop_codon:yes gene_type:complete